MYYAPAEELAVRGTTPRVGHLLLGRNSTAKSGKSTQQRSDAGDYFAQQHPALPTYLTQSHGRCEGHPLFKTRGMRLRDFRNAGCIG